VSPESATSIPKSIGGSSRPLSPRAVIHDISFLNAKIGYAAVEAGQVWKTTDGGAHWKEVLNLSYPWY